MDAKSFFELVSRMRDKQKEYFRTRSTTVLQESKSLERSVDNEIARVSSIMAGKSDNQLFDL